MLYFAYGSNMDPTQLRERVGEVGRGVTGILNRYELRFNKRSVHDEYGRANLIVDPRATTEGVLFELTDEQFTQMDRKEGSGYQRHDIAVQVGGNTRKAQTYFATAEFVVDGLHPSNEYLGHILDGAHEHRLSEAYIEKIRILALL